MPRILFLCAARERSVEYIGRRRLAELLDPALIDSYFVWQDNTQDRSQNRPAQLRLKDRNFFYDFGRDMSILPKPSKARRALMTFSRLPGALAFLSARVAHIKPDVIYTAQQSYDVLVGRVLAAAHRIPHFIHLHYPVGPWLGRLTYQIILNTETMFSVSEFTRQTAIKAGVAPSRVHTLLNSVDAGRFDVPRDRTSLREEFRWTEDTPVVVGAGRLDPSKGFMTLIDGFSKVHAQLPAARLIICGETTTRNHYDEQLKRRVAELGLENSVVFAGQRTDLPRIYAGADVFCLPTKNEAFGNVFAEAMVAGLPVVACSSGGVPEIVEEGKTGLLGPVDDADALSRHLLTVLRNPQLARELGAAGRERVMREFAPEKVAGEWSRLLLSAIARTPQKVAYREILTK